MRCIEKRSYDVVAGYEFSIISPRESKATFVGGERPPSGADYRGAPLDYIDR